MVTPQDVREAVVLVGKVEEPLEARAILFMGFLEAAVIGEQGDCGAAVRVECRAVVRAEVGKVPEGRPRVLSIIAVGCAGRALLEKKRQLSPSGQTDHGGAGTSF